MQRARDCGSPRVRVWHCLLARVSAAAAGYGSGHSKVVEVFERCRGSVAFEESEGVSDRFDRRQVPGSRRLAQPLGGHVFAGHAEDWQATHRQLAVHAPGLRPRGV